MTDPFVSPDPREETALTRQTERLAAVPELYKAPLERLALELAMGLAEPDEVFSQHGYSQDEAIALMATPSFAALLSRIGTEVRESGVSFRSKAKAIAEELLSQGFDIATDPLQSAAVRVSLIQWFAKMAGHEPAPNKGEQPGGAGFNLSITFAGQAPQAIITGHEPVTLENGA